MQTLTVKVPLKGIAAGDAKTSIDADGFVGTSCRDATRIISEALGSVDRELDKPEMYQSADNPERLHRRGGEDAEA